MNGRRVNGRRVNGRRVNGISSLSLLFVVLLGACSWATPGTESESEGTEGTESVTGTESESESESETLASFDGAALRDEPEAAPVCTLPGIYDAQRRATLRTPVEGRLELAGLAEGDAAAAAELLARVVDPRVEVELRSSAASIRVHEREQGLAAAALRHADEQANSMRTIADYVAHEEVRVLERTAELGQHTLARSRAATDLERVRQHAITGRGELGELRVEFDATIVEVLAEPGAWLPALTPILTVVDRDARRVRVLVDPGVAATLALGQRVEVTPVARPDAPPVELPIVSIGVAVLDHTGLVELALDATALDEARIGELVRVHAPWHARAWCTGT